MSGLARVGTLDRRHSLFETTASRGFEAKGIELHPSLYWLW